jgi:hypothetical protein
MHRSLSSQIQELSTRSRSTDKMQKRIVVTNFIGLCDRNAVMKAAGDHMLEGDSGVERCTDNRYFCSYSLGVFLIETQRFYESRL